jgi:hypothetical protein
MASSPEIKLIERLRKTKLNLLTHTQNIYPYNVALEYLKDLCGTDKYGFLVTNEENIPAIQEIFSDYGDDYIYKDTIFPVAYGDETLPYMRFADSVVIFDSLKMIASVDDIPAFKNILTKMYEKFHTVIIIADSDYDQADINKMVPFFAGDMTYLSDKKLADTLSFPKINNCRKPIFITEEQKVKIDNISIKNLEGTNWYGQDMLYDSKIWIRVNDRLEEDQSPKRFFNIVYPYNVSKVIESSPNVDQGLTTVINLFGKAQVFKYTPKFMRLNDTLCLKSCKEDGSKNRHLILTGYPILLEDNLYFGEYGGDLIYNLLTTELEGDCVYSPSEVMRLYVGDPVENMKLFNSDTNYKILIANELPPIVPFNINHFHIMDTKLDVAFALIDILYKNHNYIGQSPSPDLDIHLYYMSSRKEDSVNKEASRMTYESYDFHNFKLALNKMQTETVERWNYEYAYQVRKDGNFLTIKKNPSSAGA